MNNHAMERAEVLIEALPYIQKFRDDLVVMVIASNECSGDLAAAVSSVME